ncbi:MAG: hypothetical protein AAF548_12615 [Actinomycetota bacterium]
MSETRPSSELMADAALPPCQIDQHGGTPVFGNGCEGVAAVRGEPRRFDHRGCSGWWEDTNTAHGGPPGFRCSCECHAREHGWPGWDAFLTRS